MFERLGRTMFRSRWWVVGLAVVFFAFGAIWGTQVFGALTTEGFEDPASESSRALDQAEATLGRTGNDVVVLYTSPGETVDDPAFQRAVTETLDALPDDVVTRTITYWGTHSPGLVSHDRHATIAVLTMAGDDERSAATRWRRSRTSSAPQACEPRSAASPRSTTTSPSG
jgi:RND superfamily putative drug exporter